MIRGKRIGLIRPIFVYKFCPAFPSPSTGEGQGEGRGKGKRRS